MRLLAEEGGHERVVVEVGLEGFNILDAAGSRALRKYPLHHISRWSMRGNSLVLFTRSPVRTAEIVSRRPCRLWPGAPPARLAGGSTVSKLPCSRMWRINR